MRVRVMQQDLKVMGESCKLPVASPLDCATIVQCPAIFSCRDQGTQGILGFLELADLLLLLAGKESNVFLTIIVQVIICLPVPGFQVFSGDDPFDWWISALFTSPRLVPRRDRLSHWTVAQARTQATRYGVRAHVPKPIQCALKLFRPAL